MPLDVTMPDGTLFKDIPEGTTKQQILDKFRQYKVGQIKSDPLALKYPTAHEMNPAVKEGSITPPQYGAKFAEEATSHIPSAVGQVAGETIGALGGPAGMAVGGALGSMAGTALEGGSGGEIASSGVLGAIPGAYAGARGAQFGATVRPSALAEASVDAPHPRLPQTEKALAATRVRLSQQEAQLQNMIQSNPKPNHIGYDVAPAIENAFEDAKMNARLNSMNGESVAQALEDAKKTHLAEIKNNYGGTVLNSQDALAARRAFDTDAKLKALPESARQGIRNTYNDAMYAGVHNPGDVKRVMVDYSRLIDTKNGLQNAVQGMRTAPAAGYWEQFQRVNPNTAAVIKASPYIATAGGLGAAMAYGGRRILGELVH